MSASSTRAPAIEEALQAYHQCMQCTTDYFRHLEISSTSQGSSQNEEPLLRALKFDNPQQEETYGAGRKPQAGYHTWRQPTASDLYFVRFYYDQCIIASRTNLQQWCSLQSAPTRFQQVHRQALTTFEESVSGEQMDERIAAARHALSIAALEFPFVCKSGTSRDVDRLLHSFLKANSRSTNASTVEDCFAVFLLVDLNY